MQKRSSLFLLVAILSFFKCLPVISQAVIAKEGSFGVDHQHKIIVWHHQNLDDLNFRTSGVLAIKFDKDFEVLDQSEEPSYSKSISVSHNKEAYSLYFTKLPLVHITIDTIRINKNTKIPGYFTYFEKDSLVQNLMGVRHRGNLSLTYPKKSFDIEFWKDSVSKVSIDYKFGNMRLDDDWILDGLFNEPLRLRSYVSSEIWSKIHNPYYRSKEPKAKSGFNQEFVELFKNEQYYGVYALSESVDRKQLQLKDYVDNQVFGELFKASSYEGATEFLKAPGFNNVFPHWGGFEMEYPLIDYRAHWDELYKSVKLTVNGTDQEFMMQIASRFKISNAVDYYIFVNLLRATDNLGKNYYLGKYDQDEPYFFVPWDLDGVMGTIQDGKRIPTTNDILTNGLFERLSNLNPNGFNEKVKTRWKELRETHFNNTELFSFIDEVYHTFLEAKIYEREQVVWPNNLTVENHYEYLKKWLTERLIYLDSHFDGL